MMAQKDGYRKTMSRESEWTDIYINHRQITAITAPLSPSMLIKKTTSHYHTAL